MSWSKIGNIALSANRDFKKKYKHGWSAPGCPTFESFILTQERMAINYVRIGAVSPDQLGDVFMTRALLIDGCDNYYIETRELLDFLRDTEIKETSPLLSFVAESGSPCSVNKKAYNYVIHFPATNDDFDSVFVHADTSSVMISFGADDVASVDYSCVNYKWRTSDSRTKIAKQNMNLAMNMFLYASCFPDCITNEAPHEVSFDKRFAGKHKIVRAHESLIDRSGPSPHFRRGHFRHLTSDHWTHKRGQVVFVRSTFVNGQAKTVLDSEEARDEMGGMI